MPAPRPNHCSAAASVLAIWRVVRAGAIDALAVAQRLGEQLPQHDSHVLHGVVLIHVEVAFGVELQIEAAMFGEELQHVVEETNAGLNLVAAAAFDRERALNAGLLGMAADGGASRPAHSANTSSR